MKEILEIHGFAEGATDSPKMILKTAYKAGMIKDEELWLSALQERNILITERLQWGLLRRQNRSFIKCSVN